MAEIALDLETLSLVDDPDFRKGSDWKPFVAGLAYRDEHGTVEGEVLFREDDSLEAERKLLWEIVMWIDERTPVDTLLTYNGISYDIRILAYRSRLCSRPSVPEDLTVCSVLCGLIEGFNHRDLFVEAKSLLRPGKKWPTVEEACDSRDIEVKKTTYEDEQISGANMPEMGSEILSRPLDETSEIREVVTRYALSDVTPLFDLADQLEIERNEPKTEPSIG